MSQTSLTLKNYMLQAIVVWLAGEKLSGSQTRARSRFLRNTKALVDDVEAERVSIVQKHANKDAEGKPALKEDKLNYDVAEENLAKVNAEYGDLLNEDVILDLSDSMVADLEQVKAVLKGLDGKFTKADGDLYNAVCEVLQI